MAFYPGFKGRVLLWDSNNTAWSLYAYKLILTSKSPEEDVTTAQSDPVNIGRKFVVSQVPRIDFQCEAFWDSANNPFGNADPLEIGFTYRCQAFFDKSKAANIDGTLLILGCELQSGVRDVVRYTLSGVFNGGVRTIDGNPFFLPSS